MSDKTKNCTFCGEEIKAVAVKCKHCGSELEIAKDSKPTKKTSKLTMFFTFIVAIIVIAAVLNGNDNPAVSPTASTSYVIPAEQQSFVQIVESFYQPYRDAGSNELQKSQQRLLRREALQSSLSSLNFNDWIGTIANVGTTGDGNAYVAIELHNSSIELMTTNNELSDAISDIKTLIQIGSTLFNSLINLEEDDVVRFSGRFIESLDDNDLISAIAITERGSMIDPSLLIRVDAISIASSSNSEEIAATGAGSIAPEPLLNVEEAFVASNSLWGLTFGMSPDEAGAVTNHLIQCSGYYNQTASCTLLENNSRILLSFLNQEVDRQNCCIGEGGELGSIAMNMGQYTSASRGELLDSLNERYELLFEPSSADRSQWRLGEGSITYFFENRYDAERPRYLYLEISRAFFDLTGNLRQDMDLFYVAESVGAEMLAERESAASLLESL